MQRYVKERVNIVALRLEGQEAHDPEADDLDDFGFFFIEEYEAAGERRFRVPAMGWRYWLDEHSLLPDAGGVAAQDERKMADIFLLKRLIENRRAQIRAQLKAQRSYHGR